MGAARPLVSIVIDNYNYAQFLDGAIGSALAQTYPSVEVIVVDDGSTDASRDVISRHRGAVREVLKANGGQASALNAGFAVSAGEIVLFLDSDDLLSPSAVDRVVAELRPEDAKAQFRLQVIDDEGRPGPGTVPAQKFPLGAGAVLGSVLRHGRYVSSPNSGNAFPRRLIERMGPVPEGLRAADTFYVYGAPFLGSIRAIEEVLGFYRVHQTNQWGGAAAHGTPQIPHFGVPLDLARHQLIRDLAERDGLVGDGAALSFHDPNHLLARMASLRLEDGPTRASFDRSGMAGDDTAAALLRAALPVVLSGDGGRARRRGGTAALLLAMAVAPKSTVSRMARWYFDPGSRSAGPARRGMGTARRMAARAGRSAFEKKGVAVDHPQPVAVVGDRMDPDQLEAQ